MSKAKMISLAKKMADSKGLLSVWLFPALVGCGLLLICSQAHAAEVRVPLNEAEVKEIATQVDQETTNAVNEGKIALIRLLTRPLSQGLRRPIALQSADARRGKSLPGFFLHPRVPGADFEDLLSGESIGIRDDADEFRAAWRLVTVIPKLMKTQSTELVDWLSNRSENLPPDKADLVVSVVLSSYSFDMGDGFLKKTLSTWRKMLSARNPVYRLAALWRLRIFEKDHAKALAACKRALREKNSIFHYIAIQELERIGGPKAAKALKEFLDRKPPPDDGTMGLEIDVVAEATEALNRMAEQK